MNSISGVRERRDPGAPGSPWRPVAVVSALALGSIGAAAAPRLGFPAALGAVAGGVAAILAVVALPSLPTRRVAVVMLGLAGLGALRHAALPTTDSMLIVLWAGATLVALVLIDRAQAERIPQLAQGHPLGPRVPEALRVAALVAAIVVAVAVAVVPTVTDHVGRRMWPGTLPSLGDGNSAPGSLRTTPVLDMTSRPRLSDRVVFTVDAPRADFWRGEVFDTWNGQSSWTRSDDGRATRLQREGNTYQLQPDPYDVGATHGTAMRQTFHIETGVSEVLFAAPSAVSVESDRIILGHADGTAAVLGEFGKDAVYTVVSKSSLPTADDLRAAGQLDVPGPIVRQYAAPPRTSPRVRALAEQITADAPTTYDKIRAIEQWLSTHTRYSLQAPLSPRGADVVDYFLFTSRLGWCEQVSSSMAVLARSVGIPARLATGFVPGEKDGLSGHFVVRERDAHAWTEIYFPGVGWQGFDPTASVPLAGDAPHAGSWMDEARDHLVQFAIALGLLVWLAISAPSLVARFRRRFRRRASWASGALGRLERVGSRAGRARAPAETPREYAHALADRLEEPRLDTVGEVIDRDEFAAGGADPAARAAADAVLDELLAAHHGRRTVGASRG
jgi:transglutaminase-like putative cysteine protease